MENIYYFKNNTYKIVQETKININGALIDAFVYKEINKNGTLCITSKKNFFELFKEKK